MGDAGASGDGRRVLMVITRMAVGGAPRCLLAVATGLRERGYRVTLVTGIPDPSEGSLLNEVESLGLDVRVVETLGRALNPVRDVKAFRAIVRILREETFDIVHTHLSKAGVLGRMAARFVGGPLVVHTYHGDVFDGYFGPVKSGILLAAECAAASLSDALFAVSAPLAGQLLRRGIGSRDRFHVARNGIDTSRFTRARGDGRTVGAVAMFYPIKRLDVLFEAARLVLAERPDTRFVLAGGGDADRQVREAAADMGDRFRFLGIVEDIPSVLAELDVFVSTSDYEGAGVSLMEAMSSGLPVVSTRAGGTEEIVTDGEDGFLVPAGQPGDVADRVLRLLEDAELRARMGESGLEKARTAFTADASVDRIASLYDMLKRGAS